MTLTLTNEQIAAADEANRKSGLNPRSIRIIQYVIKVPVTGQFSADMPAAMAKWVIERNPIVPQLYEAIKAGKAGAAILPPEWKNMLNSLSALVNTDLLAKAFVGKLGEVSEANMYSIVKFMAENGLHALALILAADFYKLPVEEGTVAFGYDESLADAYQTRIAFTDMVFTPARDKDRTREGMLLVAAAPYKELAIRIGKPAFENADRLKNTLKFAFGIEIKQLTAVRPMGALMATERQKAVASNSVRYSEKRLLKMLQGAAGGPKSGKMDDDTVNAIAGFQKRAGLKADGLLNEATVSKLMEHCVKEFDLPEAAAYLTAGFFNMRTDHLTALAYNKSGTAVNGSGAIPGLYFVEVGAGAFSLPFIEFAKGLAKHMCALVVYKGPAFTGQHSGNFDSAFLPSIQKVNDYAARFGVQIMISGPSASTFRPEGTVVAGAVVTPAARSNHKIGHAIDFNLIAEGRHYNAAALNPRNEANWGAPVRNFINAIRKDGGLRWGGDFGTTDPIHIDDGLNGKPLEYDQRLLATQSAWSLAFAAMKASTQTATRGLSDAPDEPIDLDCGS